MYCGTILFSLQLFVHNTTIAFLANFFIEKFHMQVDFCIGQYIFCGVFSQSMFIKIENLSDLFSFSLHINCMKIFSS
jgi:hypothetical protein